MNIRQPFPALAQRELERISQVSRPANLREGEPGRTSHWSYPEAETFRSESHCDVRLFIPGLEYKSVMVEAGESMLVISGLRWDEDFETEGGRLSPFRRMVDLPVPVRQDGWQISCHGNVLFLRLVPEDEAQA